MATVDRAYGDSLVAIRRAADLAQVELANQMGVAQSEISRIEQRQDILLSDLLPRRCRRAPRVVATDNSQDVELDLTTLARAL